MNIRHVKMVTALCLSIAFVTACSNRRDPALQAVAAAEAALAEIRNNAARFAPDALRSADATLADLKTELTREDYKAVLAGVPQLNQEVTLVKDTVITQQTQMAAATHEWERLNAEVPKSLDAIQIRIAYLSGSRLPKEVTKESFAAAKPALESLKATWTEASAAFDAGNPADAADKGRTVEAKAKEVSEQLAMNPV